MRQDNLAPSPLVATVDFQAEGIQHGFLRMPYSRDDSAWGSVLIPITVAKNGDGPTALLTGGNHGDEYEGPIAPGGVDDREARLAEMAGELVGRDQEGVLAHAPPQSCTGATERRGQRMAQ